MKKYFLMLLVAVFTVSCSKKIDVRAKITGGSPLERIEFIEATGAGALPLINIGTDKSGMFTGSFEAPKNGMYMISYAGKQGIVYLKGGQTFEFTADAANFPESIKVTGDAKNNNDFITATQKFITNYASKVDMQTLIVKDEANFLKEAKKIKSDIEKNLDDSAKKFKTDNDLLEYKKDELSASILGLLYQYENNHGRITQNPSFKVSQTYKDYVKSLDSNSDRMMKNQPLYRNYILSKLASDYRTFTANNKPKDGDTNSTIFAKFLDTRKDLSQTTKDNLLALIMEQYDISGGIEDDKTEAKLEKLIDDKIKDSTIKTDIKKLLHVMAGPKKGELANDSGLTTQDGKSFKFSSLKGKPTMVMFYSSWVPYINQTTVPVLKEVVDFYKSKSNFVFVNLDDTKDQFIKTSNALLKGIPGTNVYAEGGLNSKFADQWTIYAFKLPSFIFIDKDGKVSSRFFQNLGDERLIAEFEKLTGLKAPEVAPSATLQNNLVTPEPATK